MTLVDSYFPFDQGPGATATPANWRSMARNFVTTGVIPNYANQMNPTWSGTAASGNATIATGACWIDGFYGEITPNSKTVATTGPGTVVARMDPGQRQIYLLFIPGALSKNLTGLYDIPLLSVSGTTARDVRQFAIPVAGSSHFVVAQTTLYVVLSVSLTTQTAWTAIWNVSFQKVRPDTLFDIIYLGSGWAGVAGGNIDMGFAITGPVASAVGGIAHFLYNTAAEHHAMAGAWPGVGAEMKAAGAVGACTGTVYVRNNATTAPQWKTDAHDRHTLQIVERMP